MKNERLFELLNQLDDTFIDESESVTIIDKKKYNRRIFLKIIAACLCILIISAAIIGIAQKLGKASIIPDSDTPVTIEDLNALSASPLRYGSPALSSNGSNSNTLSAEEISPHAAMTVRLVETLPHIYTFYDCPGIQYMILKMEVLEVLHGNNIPTEFYYLIPEECFTDFSIYDCFVLEQVVQYSFEYSVMYNITNDCPEYLDMVLLGAYGLPLTVNGGASDIIAFDKNGNFDSRLYESTDGFSGGSGWCNEENREYIVNKNSTLEITKSRILEDTWGKYRLDFNIRTFSDFSQGSQKVIKYINNPKSGLYVSTFKNYTRAAYLFEDESVLFRRYIGGIATNEAITISPDKVEYTTASFDEAELSSLPSVRSAYIEICEEFETGKIAPPHIEGYENMKNTVSGIYPWYAKTEDGVVGIVQVSWCFVNYSDKMLCYDDAYFIVTADSENFTRIERNELIKMFGDLEATFIYTGEYDNLGKIYKDRDSDYIVVY